MRGLFAGQDTDYGPKEGCCVYRCGIPGRGGVEFCDGDGEGGMLVGRWYAWIGECEGQECALIYENSIPFLFT